MLELCAAECASNGHCSSCIVFGRLFIVCAYGDAEHTASTRSENDNRAAAGLGNARAGWVWGTLYYQVVLLGACLGGYFGPCERGVDRVGMVSV